MGDDSSRNLNPLNVAKQSDISATSIKPNNNEENAPHATYTLVHVLYSHSKTAEPPQESERKTVLCDSFDELLTFLEEDLVDTIWFDDSVELQERSYIAGWAKIFRPDLKTQILPNQNQLH